MRVGICEVEALLKKCLKLVNLIGINDDLTVILLALYCLVGLLVRGKIFDSLVRRCGINQGRVKKKFRGALGLKILHLKYHLEECRHVIYRILGHILACGSNFLSKFLFLRFHLSDNVQTLSRSGEDNVKNARLLLNLLSVSVVLDNVLRRVAHECKT